MAKIATPNYSTAQETIILNAIRENGNVANLALAEVLAAREDMRDNDGQVRKARAITAKMSRMAEANGFTYERKAPTTKDGKAVTKKTDLVARIATLSGVTAAKLNGLETAPKLALESLVSAFAEREAA